MGCENSKNSTAVKPGKVITATKPPPVNVSTDVRAASSPEVADNLASSLSHSVQTLQSPRRSPSQLSRRSPSHLRALHLSLRIPNPREEAAYTEPIERKLSVNEALVHAEGMSIISTLRAMSAPVHRVVLTGGPCAGKSTSLGMLQTKLLSAGFNVYCVPEAATLLVNGGLTWTEMTEDKATLYQLALLRTQIALEDAFLDIAKANQKPAVILCDRGTMDGRAYCSEIAWQKIMSLGGYTMEELRDDRYDAVVHMMTAAIGAEAFYSLDNNGARTETLEQARGIDEVLRQKYVGHPKLKIITNNTPFQEKVDKVWEFISSMIGVGKPKTSYKRYLVKECPPDSALTVPFERIELKITILAHSVIDAQHLLIKRQNRLTSHYTYQNIFLTNGEKQRVEHRLTVKEYRSLELQAHPNHCPIVKSNLTFTYGDHYFELGVFQEPARWGGIGVLYVETDPENVPTFPPFLEAEREVTHSDEFSSFTISAAEKDSGGHKSPTTSRKTMSAVFGSS